MSAFARQDDLTRGGRNFRNRLTQCQVACLCVRALLFGRPRGGCGCEARRGAPSLTSKWLVWLRPLFRLSALVLLLLLITLPTCNTNASFLSASNVNVSLLSVSVDELRATEHRWYKNGTPPLLIDKSRRPKQGKLCRGVFNQMLQWPSFWLLPQVPSSHPCPRQRIPGRHRPVPQMAPVTTALTKTQRATTKVSATTSAATPEATQEADNLLVLATVGAQKRVDELQRALALHKKQTHERHAVATTIKCCEAEIQSLQNALDLAKNRGHLQSALRATREMLSDPDVKEIAEEEGMLLTQSLERVNTQLLHKLMLPELVGNPDVLVEVRAGAGGAEAAIWASDLLKVFAVGKTNSSALVIYRW
eukprot:GHVT01004209.1.p1 GENE.GHVT01004209.1~~GHVT01004209.1.p1  ORF type:complete len:363 (-),score=49.63 GHVT01004209.1:1831-2919(-)